MTADSVFWIASMTKAITSTAAMQLVEEGKLALDRPIADLLPEIATAAGAGTASTPPASRSCARRGGRSPCVTCSPIPPASSTTSGNAEIGRYMEKAGGPRYRLLSERGAGITARLRSRQKWDYGIGIDWAGKAVERASGQTLGDYFADHLFGPIGMKDTGFRLTPDRRARLRRHACARGYWHARTDRVRDPAGARVPDGRRRPLRHGGRLSRFQRVFLNKGRADGRQVLEPETAALIAQNAIGDLDVRMLKTAVPGSSNDAEFFPGMVKNGASAS